ncbi:mechanosensitive ion channel [Chloracidobacterium validum]|uniref:Mechanosensitive ion channel n=1 Tax=Chloracidobacterium validum TaxID=2821543 RepID=A0ABX8BDV8_9BACT|nr:mechanosensitive ion channel family protein [Chloracidobacterium validum]QUW04206.1 mechanosensitive ion channel [Chloracidobacterium validum]
MAQAPPATVPATRPSPVESGVPVQLGGEPVFRIRARLGTLTPSERAAIVERRLVELAATPFLNLEDLRTVEYDETIEIVLGNRVITVVTEADATAAELPRSALAQSTAEHIKRALYRVRQAASWQALLVGVLLSLVVTTLIIGVWRGLDELVARLRHAWHITEPSTPHSSRLLNRLDVLVGGRLRAARLTLLTVIWFLARAGMVVAYLPLVFSFFPATQGLSRAFWEAVLTPLVTLWSAFILYIPNLLFILTVAFLTWAAIQGARLLSLAVERGVIVIGGFDPEWARPTYKLVVIFLVAAGLIIAFPYIPGVESPAFRGVSIFIGALFSLASSSAIANVVSGIVLTYTRAFRIGDRVRIGETTGDVVEKTLFVTRLETIKQEIVSIPNAQVLNGTIVNYSTLARTRGIILHTTVTLGYETPWRRVHELLTAAARATAGIRAEPPPFVWQTSLNDFHVAYELNAYTNDAWLMPYTYAALHANIRDVFDEAGVEIMSPHVTALRDGNRTTVARDHVPTDYQAPAFRVAVQPSDEQPRSASAHHPPQADHIERQR